MKKPPTTVPRVPKPARTAQIRDTAGDAALWAHVTASVTPMGGKKKSGVAKPTAKAKKPAAPAEKARPAALPRPSVKASTSASTGALVKAPAIKNTEPGFDRATQTRLRKGQLAIEGRLDLHGMTQAQAHEALERFVTRAHAQGKRTLLVITGKGRVSTGGGVLRRLLPLWLTTANLRPLVLACTPATIKDGGDGAFYIRLRKTR